MFYPVYSFTDFMLQVDPGHVFLPATIDLCSRIYDATFGINMVFWNDIARRESIMGITIGSSHDVELKISAGTMMIPTGFRPATITWTTPWNVASNGYAAPTDIINRALSLV